MTQKKKNNIIIGSLCAVVLLMVVGYAAFSSVLNIKGTSSISSNWNIKITKIEEKNIVGGAETATNEAGEKKITGIGTLTASFETNLVSPGDSIEYDITVANEGSLNAKLDKITLSDSKNPAIKFTSSGLEEGSELNAGESKILTVKVEYLNSVTSQPDNTKGTLTVTLDYSQKEGSSVPINPITSTDLVSTAVTEGDGLYADDAEAGRHIYKGTSPNNYITFNNETWRIMSVENDGTIKIIRNESIGSMSWDAKGTRDSSTSTYCTKASSWGCNAWAATTNLLNKPVDFTLHYPNGDPSSDATTYSGTVTQDASLNTYLNGEYLNSLGEDAQYITNHNFNIGTPGNNADTESIAIDVSQEALYKWNGKVGLMNVTDILRTTTDTGCTSLNVGRNNGSKSVCSNNNWMWPTSTEWTLSPSVSSYRNDVWYVSSSGSVGYTNANVTYGVRPVFYLTSDINLVGSGTSEDPYTISI